MEYKRMEKGINGTVHNREPWQPRRGGYAGGHRDLGHQAQGSYLPHGPGSYPPRFPLTSFKVRGYERYVPDYARQGGNSTLSRRYELHKIIPAVHMSILMQDFLATLLLDPVPPETLPPQDAAGHPNEPADMPAVAGLPSGLGLPASLLSCGVPPKDTPGTKHGWLEGRTIPVERTKENGCIEL